MSANKEDIMSRRLFHLLKPLGDRIVIELIEAEEKTSSGIVLPDSAKEKPQEGKVVAAGTGRVLENGQVLTWKLKKATASSSQNMLELK